MPKFTPKTETQMEIDELERGRLRSKVLNFLKANDIVYKLYEHPALCSVEECLVYWSLGQMLHRQHGAHGRQDKFPPLREHGQRRDLRRGLLKLPVNLGRRGGMVGNMMAA